jgi:hypothetical protein
MNLLAWPALILLAAAVTLIALAAFRPGPKRKDVGTLLIWRRVTAQQVAHRERRRNFDPLLWLLLAAVVLGAFAAARPAWMTTDDTPRVAVYIERLEPAGAEPLLDEVMARAREAAPDAELTFFMSGADDEVVALNPGTFESELAQFIARSEDFDGRVMFLHAANDADTGGRALPRVTFPRRDVVFALHSLGDKISFRTTGITAPSATGAELSSSDSTAGETIWSYRGTANDVSFSVGEREIRLTREPYVVGVGEDWSGAPHRALFEALGTDSADQHEPRVWLGTKNREPALRINVGQPTDLTGMTLSFDPGHPLFHDLPLESFDWLAAGRLLAPDAGARSLLTARRTGEPVGDVVRLRGDVLEFAGDPFSFAPIASAALLLDNAIGVVTGTRPSERPGYRLTTAELPSRRAALSAPFAPVGELDLSSRREAAAEFTSWLMLVAAALLVVAAWRVSGSGPRQP